MTPPVTSADLAGQGVDPLATPLPVGYHRVALTVSAGELAGRTQSLLDRGFRIALAAGHDGSGTASATGEAIS